ALMAACSVAVPPPTSPDRFVCDGSLGGLARWLRAAGYDAAWAKGRSGRSLVGEAREQAAVLLTSDSRLLREAGLSVGEAIHWVPATMRPVAQLRLVLRDLGLGPREPRCMSCGGKLRVVSKEAV